LQTLFLGIFFGDVDPNEENFQVATGNEQATLDKEYCWVALLLWPVEKYAVKGDHSTGELPAKKQKVKAPC